MPAGLFLVRFEARYPGLFAAPGRWPTRDGCIPWRIFWLFLRAIPALEAAEQLEAIHTTATAIALTFGSEDGQKEAERMLTALRRRAGGSLT